jgi:hypothetical protein
MPDQTGIVADRIILAICTYLTERGINITWDAAKDWKELIVKELLTITTPDIAKTPTQPDYATITINPCPVRSSVINLYTIRYVPLGTPTDVLACCLLCAAKQYSEACKISGLFEVTNKMTGEHKYIEIDKNWSIREIKDSPPYLFDR